MSEKIASLYAEISADTTKLEKGLAATNKGLTNTAAQMKKTSGTFKDFVGSLPPGVADMLSFSGAIGAAALATKAAINTTVQYAEEVRNLSQVTGMTAEDTSRLIQITDDHKISVDALTMAQRKLSAEGKSLSADTLAKLADDYNSLGSAAAKSQFLIQKFGKSGFQFAELLAKGGAAVREEWAGVSGALVLDQAALDSAREYEMQIDALSDSFDALKVEAGTKVLPVINALFMQLNKNIGESGALVGLLKFGFDDIWQALFSPDEATDALQTAMNTAVSNVNSQGIDTTNLINWEDINARTDWAGALGLAEGMQAEMDRFKDEKDKLLAAKAELDAQFANNPGAAAYKKELADINAALAENTKAHQENVNAMVLDVVKQNLAQEGMTPDEFEKYVQLASNMGVMDENTAAAAVSTMRLADAFVNANMPATQFLDAINSIWALPPNKNFSVSFSVNGGPNLANVMDIAKTGGATRGTAAYTGRGEPGERAAGGPLFPGKSYMVGERGPELAQWTGSGWNIIPNHQLAGGMADGGYMPSNSYNVTVNNPLPEMASSSVNRTLKNLSYLGAQ